MKISTLSLVVFAVCIVPFSMSAQGFLHTRQTSIVNGIGEEVKLKGMGIGGWMLQEGYMLKINKNGTQHEIKQRIKDLVGPENCNRFYGEWIRNFFRKSDVDSLAHWGFNSIRLPMHYNLFTLPVEQEPVSGENTWIQSGFDLVDSVVLWCKINKMYLILDLHAAPGGQGTDANIADYNPDKPGLWESEANRKKTIALWKKLAAHYANEPSVGGYDLINEPNWTWEGKNIHGQEDTLNTDIWTLYKDITIAIREVDKNHILFIEGNGFANNYNGFPGIWDQKMVLSFHKYWNSNRKASIMKFLQIREKYQVPLWLGESGENSDQWFSDCIRLMDENNIGWSWWTLKKLGSFVCPLSVKVPKEYRLMLDYWNQIGPEPAKEVALKALFQITENVKTENCLFVKDYIDAMFRQVNDTLAIPYHIHLIPCTVKAVDYDMGQMGYAYCDSDYQNTNHSKTFRSQWNKGGAYRNDGVDIKAATDSLRMNHPYYIFSTEDGEWLTYTLNVTESGLYQVNAEIASDSIPGIIHLIFDNHDVLEVTVNTANGSDHFKDYPAGIIHLSAGIHQLKVFIVKGGICLNEFVFSKVILK